MTDRKPRVLAVDHNAVTSADRAIYRELAKAHGYELSVIVPEVWEEQFGPVTYEPESSAVNVIPSGVFFKGKSHRVIYRALSAALHSTSPDLLLVNAEPEGFAAFQAVLLSSSLRSRPKVIFETWRNIPYGRGGERFPVRWAWLSARIEAFVLRRCAHGIQHSPGGSAAFHNTGFDRITEIPPWVDQSIFAPSSRPQKSDRVPSGSITIGFVGRFVPEKGILFLLKAVAGSGIDAKVILVGDGPQTGELKAFLKMTKNPPVVNFVPPVPHPAMPEQLRKFDILVLPSVERQGWREQFGRVLIEAMACGVPVVGTSSGAIPTVIGNAGLIVPPGDVNALAHALRRLADNPAERAAFAEAGIKRVAAEFSVPVVGRKLAVLFNSLMQTPALPSL
jgi:glycosyltransferase involved in cell wall biosynthesis